MTGMTLYTLYCHTHIESGRRYVGLTKKTMMHRWNRHVHSANWRRKGKGVSHFANAIRKYGEDAFSHEVLEICKDLEVANLAEACWIEFYETRNPKKGFNLMPGGGFQPHPVSNPWDRPEFRIKMAEASRLNWLRPSIRMNHSKAVKESFTEERLAKSSAATKAVRSKPENKEVFRKLWADPGYAEKSSFGTKRGAEIHKSKTHCPSGHEYSGDNVFTSEKVIKGKKYAGRHCRTCANSRAREKHIPTERVLKTHCNKGHKFTPENTQVTRDGRGYDVRRCRVCNGIRQKIFHDKKRASKST